MRPQIRRNVSSASARSGAAHEPRRWLGRGSCLARRAFLASSMASKSSLPIVRAMSAEFSHSSASTAAPQTSAMRLALSMQSKALVDPLAYALGKGLVHALSGCSQMSSDLIC